MASSVPPDKAAFIDAVTAAILAGPVDLVCDLSGYGEGGWSRASGPLEEHDARVVALSAWYRFSRVPVPPAHLLHQEARSMPPVLQIPEDKTLDMVNFIAGCLREWGWRADTAVDPSRWSVYRPETGQCAVTALVVQDRCGGELVRVVVDGQSHYFNRLADGREIDLTSGQFDSYEPEGKPEVRTRDYVLENPSTRSRYLLLRKRLDPVLDESSRRRTGRPETYP